MDKLVIVKPKEFLCAPETSFHPFLARNLVVSLFSEDEVTTMFAGIEELHCSKATGVSFPFPVTLAPEQRRGIFRCQEAESQKMNGRSARFHLRQ
jgi:hypothetical protein